MDLGSKMNAGTKLKLSYMQSWHRRLCLPEPHLSSPRGYQCTQNKSSFTAILTDERSRYTVCSQSNYSQSDFKIVSEEEVESQGRCQPGGRSVGSALH